jgi:phosphate-selective porin
MKFLTVLVVLFLGPGLLVHAQTKAAKGKPAKKSPATATREEVQELRKEVAEQKQTIGELKGMVQRLVEANQQAAAAAQQAQAAAAQAQSAAGDAQHSAVRAQSTAETAQKAAAHSEAGLAEAKTATQAVEKKVTAAALQSGWNGEHFFLKSSDGNFLIQPYGYVQLDYRAYNGDGHPPDTFTLRRGRFGFQGTLGKHYEFALLADFADTSSTLLRDFYINVKYLPEIQFTFGQFKEPFAQEELTGITNIDTVERSVASLLYPSPTSFRSPGVMIHGDLVGGAVQYFVGAFNGKGTLGANTTNEPEVVGRLKFYPWKKSKNEMLKGLTFAGSIGHGRTKGLSNELSFNGVLPDAAFTFFPRFAINGPVERYEGDFTWVKGPWAVRAEYDQLNQFRRALSSFAGGVGQNDLPGVVSKAYYAGATYLLTGEKRPENGAVKPKHPFFTADGGHGLGAWELKFRYAKIQAKTPNTSFSTGILSGAEAHMDQFTTGFNWYPSYFVRYSLDLNVDRARDPTTANVLPQNFFVVLQRLQFRF